MNEKRKRGRPPLEETRGYRYSVRLNYDEECQLQSLMADLNMTASEVFRKILKESYADIYY